jgi:hypothetical protein
MILVSNTAIAQLVGKTGEHVGHRLHVGEELLDR